MSSDLYDIDLAAWSARQSEALRRRAGNEIDWDNVAEEIESLGGNLRVQLKSRITTVLEHLVRLQASPSLDPRNGWRRTILRERGEIADLLDENPSLRPLVADFVARRLPVARKLAALALAEYRERPMIEIDALDYTVEQVLGDWLP